MDYNEYLAQTVKKDDDPNIQKIENFLEGYGIEVKTVFGDYRPIHDVLKEISAHWEEICEQWEHIKD